MLSFLFYSFMVVIVPTLLYHLIKADEFIKQDYEYQQIIKRHKQG